MALSRIRDGKARKGARTSGMLVRRAGRLCATRPAAPQPGRTWADGRREATCRVVRQSSLGTSTGQNRGTGVHRGNVAAVRAASRMGVLECRRRAARVRGERDTAGRAGAFRVLQGARARILQGRPARSRWSGSGRRAAGRRGVAETCSANVFFPRQTSEALADKSRVREDWYYRCWAARCAAVPGAETAGRRLGHHSSYRAAELRCVSEPFLGDRRRNCRDGALLDTLRPARRAGRPRLKARDAAGCDNEDGYYWTGWQYVKPEHLKAERSA